MSVHEFTTLGANAKDFQRNSFGRRIWECDGCGKKDTWEPGWSWRGKAARGASWYDNGIMEWVACSEGCAAKMPRHERSAP